MVATALLEDRHVIVSSDILIKEFRHWMLHSFGFMYYNADGETVRPLQYLSPHMHQCKSNRNCEGYKGQSLGRVIRFFSPSFSSCASIEIADQ